MKPGLASFLTSAMVRIWAVFFATLALLLALTVCASANLIYYESKGPFKNWTQPVDLDGDGDLDVLVSHTRWEENDISWAGVGRWMNQGNGTFELSKETSQLTGVQVFGGFAAAAGDVDQDGDQDVLKQDFGVHLLVNQGGLQGGQNGRFEASGGIGTPPTYDQGYRDMGGTITLVDLNGDGRLDAFIAGCCYGLDAREAGYGGANAPAVSWVWMNDGKMGLYQSGHILALDPLNGRPIRQAAAGDLDGDGDTDVFAAVAVPTMGSTESPDDLILLNDGLGNLALFEQDLGQGDSTSVALGDVNGDERLDALVGTNDGATLWLNQNPERGSGRPLFEAAGQSFAAVQTGKEKLQGSFSVAADRFFGLYLPYGSVRTTAVFLEDLDGDGDLDALIGRLWSAEIWWNDGMGRFERADGRFDYQEDTGLAVADLDGDGDLDIFAAGNGPNYRVWWNKGLGTFSDGKH